MPQEIYLRLRFASNQLHTRYGYDSSKEEHPPTPIPQAHILKTKVSPLSFLALSNKAWGDGAFQGTVSQVKSRNGSGGDGCAPVTPEFRKLRREDCHELETSLEYMGRPCHKTQNENEVEGYGGKYPTISCSPAQDLY